MLSFFGDGNIRVADFLDIGVISVAIYLFISLIRETTSRSVLMGLLIVAAVFFLARTFDMYLTALLFKTAFAVLLVVLVVVFQDDIRRGFERIATLGTFLESPEHIDLSSHMDTLIEAVADMASKNTGALIAIKGRDPLDRHTRKGLALEGKITKPLLFSIFDHHSPGHDGAVIIEDQRISKFAVHLPLSDKLSKHGGTRHSAALGLSERCDALAIVVSEERGAISIAHRGELNQLDSVSELARRLHRFNQENISHRNTGGWARMITKNQFNKAFSVALACFLWFNFAYQPEIIIQKFTIPIEYRNIPEHILVSSSEPLEADLTLSGSERAFDLLDPESLRISVDLSEVQESTELTLTEESVVRPSSLDVYLISPEVVKLELDRMEKINLPIEVQTDRQLPAHLQLIGLKTQPAIVQVMVPRWQVGRWTRVLTEPVNLQLVTQTKTIKTKLALEKTMRPANSEPLEIYVTIEVAKRAE